MPKGSQYPHGGWDPGKIGKIGEDEKGINLKIAENLQTYLENSGAIVIMTRLSDEAAGDTKRADLYNRKELADLSGADIVISIHQNSFPQESVKGAQVFFHDDAEKSRVLAECIQNSINSFADKDNRRLSKENPDYYILKQTAAPAVIVECGFLSNYADEKRLNTTEYQEKMAWAIYLGVVEYFGEG